MDALGAIRARRSIRIYDARPIEREKLEILVDCGRLAATARNEQPWEFVVVTNREMLRRLGETTDHGRFIAEAPACILVFCQDTKYYLEDGAAATQNILVAAKTQGLGACWVAGDKKPYAGEIGYLAGAPPGLKLVSMIPVGYPGHDPHPSKRPLEDVLHWEHY